MKKFRKTYHYRTGGRNIRCLLPFETIEAAMDGNETAIRSIVEHYGSYILQLTGTESYTSDRKHYIIVDKTKADIMINALIDSIPHFKSLR